MIIEINTTYRNLPHLQRSTQSETSPHKELVDHSGSINALPRDALLSWEAPL